MSDITFLSASEIAEKIRDRTLSSTEMTQAYLAKIEKLNPSLNAICTLDAERALQQAKAADEASAKGDFWGALHGVPITIKDMFETVDFKTTAGYPPLKNYQPQQDATVVARLREAGAIIMGKSNLATLAGDYQSTNTLFSRVNNPWNLGYTPGGSSGGSAAAIAAGLSALEFGNDFAGSTRQPAHFCGIYGLKPTEGRISLAGTIPEVPGMPICLRKMMTVGCLARSLKDIQLAFSLVAGPDPRRPEVPPVPLDTPSGKPLPDLKIAWIDEWPQLPVSKDIRAQMQTALQQLSAHGASVKRWMPEAFDISEVLNLYVRMAVYVNLYAQPKNKDTVGRNLIQIFRSATEGDKSLRQFGNVSQALAISLNLSVKGYFETLTARDRFTTQLDEALEPWDVWIMPVCATTAFTHRPSWKAININGVSYPHGIANGAYTMPFNLSSHPAVVIPMGFTSEGLPIGLQIIGKRWKEIELIAIATQIDSIVGDFQNPPL
ncbi:MAG: amidase [Phormidesmis sp.]